MSATERSNAINTGDAAVHRGSITAERAEAHGRYSVVCVGADGKIKWTDDIDNLVTTAGKNHALDQHLGGVGYTATWYMGLISSASYTTGVAVLDLMNSHPGWTETILYSNVTRPAPVFANSASGTKVTSSAVAFSINGTITVKGCFLNTANDKGGTTGTLYSAGLFTAGDKSLINGDTLNVTYTASL